jgi:hypothetical protein
VLVADELALVEILEPGSGVFMDRFEKRKARLSLGLRKTVIMHQALVDQRGEVLENIEGLIRIAHMFN